MDRIEEMTVFVAVAELGGFASASRKLKLSAPTITRAVAALEAQVGAELFVRTTRFVRLTESGERYLQDCRRILHELEEAEAQAAGAHLAPQGTLVIAAPIVFGQRLLLPLLVEFLLQHPAVSARALLVDRPVQLSEEGIDCAFRMGELPDSALVATPLGHIRRIVCASPDYLAAHGQPQQPQEVVDHALVVSAADGRSDRWRFVEGDREIDVEIEPRLVVSTNEAAISAALGGWGLTRVMSYQVNAELQRGELQRVLQAHEGKPLPVWLVNAEGRRAAAKLRSFIAFAVARLRGHPALVG
ncbi:MAG TPA: LysR family transcriptional regulator [Xanthomonadales bacterium]|nr:LysR family transcriptional regulator [Xanthomonadales bacterium]